MTPYRIVLPALIASFFAVASLEPAHEHGGVIVRLLPLLMILIFTCSVHNTVLLKVNTVLDQPSPFLYVPIILDGYNGGDGY